MKFKEVCKSILTVILLFFIILCCIILFHQCSLEPAPVEETIEETPVTVPESEPEIEAQPEAQETQEPEEIPAEPEAQPEAEPEIQQEQIEEPQPEEPQEPQPETQPESQLETQEQPEAQEEAQEPQDISTPEVPELDYPYVNEFYEGSSDEYVEEEINWDEFVFSDAELELEDGSYYGVLYVNDDNTGSISVEQIDGVTYFVRSELASLLSGLLTDEYYAQFFTPEDEYYSLDYVSSMSESSHFDTLNLYLYLDFNNSQMPIKNISISGRSDTTSVDYSMSGATVLEPALISAQTNVGISINGYQNTKTGKIELSTGVSLSNQISFLDMVFSVPLSLYYSNSTGLSYSLGNIYGYMDYPDLSLRLSFGDVGYSGFSSGTPFGFMIEKSYSYGNDSALGNQYSQILELEEDSQIEVFVNEKSVVSRSLSMGKYRIKDFVFDQGGNDIVIKVHPISMGEDTSRDQTLTFKTDYDSSLLGRGDSLWRFGVSIPRVKSTVSAADADVDKKGFVIPAIPSYNPRTKKFDAMQNTFIFTDFSIYWEQSLGLFDNYTQSNNISIVAQKQGYGVYSINGSYSLNGTLATSLGTSRFRVGGSFTVGKTSSGDGGLSNLDFSFTYSQSFVEPVLKPLSLSMTYTANSSKQAVSLSTGYSFKVLSLSVGTSVNLKYNFNAEKESSRSASSEKAFAVTGSLSLDMPLGNKSSISVSTSMDSDFKFTAVVGFSTSIGKVSVSSSSSVRAAGVTSSLSMGFSQNTNSYSLGISNIKFDDLLNHTMAASWSHKGNWANYSLRVQATNQYQSLSYSGYISTAFAFADGYFALAKSVGGAFVMVAPQGALKKADLSVSAAMSSSVTALTKTFGAGYYSGLKLYNSNSIIVYAGSESFMFTAKPNAAQGYVARIYKEESMSATAILLYPDGSPVDSASSPVYSVELASDGVSVASRSLLEDSYMFTDEEGRFIIDALQPGVYMFDISVNDLWYAVFFKVPSIMETSDELATQLVVYKDYTFSEDLAYTDSSVSDEWADWASSDDWSDWDTSDGWVVSDESGVSSSSADSGVNSVVGSGVGSDVAQYDISSYDSSYAGSITLEQYQIMLLDDFWNMLYGVEEDSFEEDTSTTVVQTYEAAP